MTTKQVCRHYLIVAFFFSLPPRRALRHQLANSPSPPLQLVRNRPRSRPRASNRAEARPPLLLTTVRFSLCNDRLCSYSYLQMILRP